jgi:hypothetical protein
MPTFALLERPPEWLAQAPVVFTKEFALPAPPALVFARLADLASWSEWCGGMKRVRIDGAATGVGALRTVWVGATRVQERFLVWEPGARLTFALTSSNIPGLHSMMEDWAMRAHPQDPDRSILTVTVGIEAARLLRPFPRLVRAVMTGPLRGAAGITTQFP